MSPPSALRIGHNNRTILGTRKRYQLIMSCQQETLRSLETIPLSHQRPKFKFRIDIGRYKRDWGYSSNIHSTRWWRWNDGSQWPKPDIFGRAEWPWYRWWGFYLRQERWADTRGIIGIKLLLRAALGGHESVVKLLLENGDVDLIVEDCRYLTSISYAAASGHETVVQILRGNQNAVD